jgi:hypothetical protein
MALSSISPGLSLMEMASTIWPRESSKDMRVLRAAYAALGLKVPNQLFLQTRPALE